MRLRTKILLSIVPIVGAALLLTGWLVINNATRSSHDSIYRYSEGLLDTYVTQDLENRVDILKSNHLEGVPSFVERYQKEAIAAADKLNLIWPGHLFIVDNLNNVIYCSSDSMPKRLPQEWEPLREKLASGLDHMLKGHVPGEAFEAFVAHYFEPWGWAVFVTIKGDFMHEREQVIWLTVGLVGVLTSIAIVFCLGLVLNKLVLTPVMHIRSATERIAMEEDPAVIPVEDGDEFGELSRDIEGMSYKIYQSREALREAYEELETLDEMKSSLIANVSHELRTPLTSILGFAKLGLKKVDGQSRDAKGANSKNGAVLHDALCMITTQGECMAEMIDNIITLMALISRDAVAQMSFQDIATLVRRVGQDLRDKIESKGLSLTISVPSEPIPVNVDSKMIGLVLNHYLANALNFTEEGGIEIRVAQKENEVVVEVRDTGVGISRDDAEKIFDQFYQAGDVMTEKPKGLGVGLPICQRILHLHGGRVWVDSTPGEGSSFFFSLPLIEPAG